MQKIDLITNYHDVNGNNQAKIKTKYRIQNALLFLLWAVIQLVLLYLYCLSPMRYFIVQFIAYVSFVMVVI